MKKCLLFLCFLFFGAMAFAQENVLADATEAEAIWKDFAQKKWTEVQCDRAAELLESPDPVAVMWAEWALALRVGWENSNERAVWSEEMPEKPAWFEKWLAFPADRFAELDYWRIAASWGAHASLGSLKVSAQKFMTRTDGIFNEIQNSEKVSAQRKSEVRAMRTRASEILAEIQKTSDLLTARQLYVRFRLATREIVLSNPALDFDEILYTSRHSAHGLRNITGSQYPWTFKPGGGLRVKTGFQPSDPTREILANRLGPGHVHGTDLHWDGHRLVFGYAKQPIWPLAHPTHTNDAHWFFELRSQTPSIDLYEMNVDGTGLRQITNHPYWGDFEPTYAADGSIVFASDRSARSSECGNFRADHTVVNLFRCDPDGGNIRMLSDNKDIDRYPHALSNGLIGYTRWEYQERHFTEVHAFWTIHPDGTYAEAAFKQHFNTPWGLRDTRDIPNSNKYVSIATGHHTLPYGQLVIFDLEGGPNDASRLFTLTPHVVPGEGPSVRNTVPQGGLVDNVGRFAEPFPLSETSFLVSWSPHVPNHDGRLGGDTMFAIYLVDVYGNRELIHRDRILSCEYATPVKSRPTPFPIADGRVVDGRYPLPVCYVQDVNRGLPAEERGKVKFLRIMQRVGWPLDDKIGASRWAPGNAWERIYGYWTWAPAREIGTVPVEPDGSVWFYVPENRSVYFQALDENRMEIRRMRSHISLEPGESRGCTGCHETRPSVVSPQPGSLAQAFLHEPSLPDLPPWGRETLLSYEEHIQPIFDRNCVSCHNEEKSEGGLNLAPIPDASSGMLRSYAALFPAGANSVGLRPKTTKADDGTPIVEYPMIALSDKHSGAGISQTRQFGSTQSRLTRVMVLDPLHANDVRAKMSQDDWRTLVTWVDMNAPYYNTFFNRRDPDNPVPARSLKPQWPLVLETSLHGILKP